MKKIDVKNQDDLLIVDKLCEAFYTQKPNTEYGNRLLHDDEILLLV